MKGLDLARRYYEEYGKPMLREEFSDLLPYLAIGLAGSGSECLGFDDALSQDHDFEPGFCIFLPKEDVVDRKAAFRLERAYEKLPKEFLGFSRSPLSPVGGNRHGVIRTEEFFLAKTGTPDGCLTENEWFSLPEHALSEAVSGAVFDDFYGEFTRIRERLSYYPENVRIKKLAGHFLLMGQAGQYNYPRCIKRGDTAASQMAAFEFCQSALHSIYLLNKSYMPYYKWSFRGLRDLEALGELGEELENIISCGNRAEEARTKTEWIEKVTSAIAQEARRIGLLRASGHEMEALAYALNRTISDSDLRNQHILYAV